MTDKTDVLEHRVSSLERAYEQANKALQGINDSLRQLTALEARHVETKAELLRAFEAIKDHETRMRSLEQSHPKNLDQRLFAIEQAMPEVKTVTNNVTKGMLAVVAMVGVAASKVVFGW